MPAKVALRAAKVEDLRAEEPSLMADIIAFVYVWRGGEESCETWDRVVARKCTRLSGSGDPIEYPCYRPGTTSSQADEGVITRTKH